MGKYDTDRKGEEPQYLVLEVGLGHGEQELVLLGSGWHGEERGRRDQRRRRPLPHHRRELQHLCFTTSAAASWVGEPGEGGREGFDFDS